MDRRLVRVLEAVVLLPSSLLLGLYTISISLVLLLEVMEGTNRSPYLYFTQFGEAAGFTALWWTILVGIRRIADRTRVAWITLAALLWFPPALSLQAVDLWKYGDHDGFVVPVAIPIALALANAVAIVRRRHSLRVDVERDGAKSPIP